MTTRNRTHHPPRLSRAAHERIAHAAGRGDRRKRLCRQARAAHDVFDLDATCSQAAVDTVDLLYQELKHLHGLTKTSRRLLEVATWLRKLPHALEPLTDAEQALVALTVDLAQDTPRRNRRVVDEGGPDRGLVLRLAAVVRIGWEVARVAGHLTRVQDNGREVLLFVDAAEPPTLSPRTAELWSEAMDRPLRLARHAPATASTARDARAGLSTAEAVRRILLLQCQTYRCRLYGLASDRDEEYVHECRVATRRMRSALRVLGRKKSGKGVRHWAGEIKWIAKQLGRVRDHDVFLEFLSGYRDGAPESEQVVLAGLETDTRRCRAADLSSLLESVRGDRGRALLDTLLPMLAVPANEPGGLAVKGKAAQRPFHKQARRRISRSLRKLRKAERKLRKLSSKKRHRVRIRCKRVRYAAEFLAASASVKEVWDPLIDGMTEMQDTLGDVHDGEVWAERIREWSEARRADGDGSAVDIAPAVEGLLGAIRERRHSSLGQAASVWKRLWRDRILRDGFRSD